MKMSVYDDRNRGESITSKEAAMEKRINEHKAKH